MLNFKPKFLVSFGGISTNFIRQKKENLASIHGQESMIKFIYGSESHITLHFPFFHPSLLLANPSMKKVAWEDMKKLIAKV